MADAATVDKSLDDIIKERRINGRGARGGRGGNRNGNRGGNRNGNRGGGSNFRGNSLGRRSGGGVNKRRSGGGQSLSPKKAAASINGQWNHDLYQNGAAINNIRRPGAVAGVAAANGPTKLIISNLDFGVNDNDIKGLFQEFGNIRKAAVHYDKSGRSLGTADVLFERRQDAVLAIKKYNGVSLDGRPMNIQLSAPLTQAIAAPIQARRLGNLPAASGGFRRGGGGNRGGRGGQRRGGNRGGAAAGGGKQKQTPKSQADLDAELDAYNAKMQTD